MVSPRPNPIKIDFESVFILDVFNKEILKGYFELMPELFDKVKVECWHCLDAIFTRIQAYQSEDEAFTEITNILQN